MRKMKRALSLVLAMVMLLGMVMIPSGAASSFTDADLIQNTEAVEITSGIGLFAGTADGQFAPKAAVTRAQMATIIVKMLRGSDFNADAFKGVGVNPFPDTADFEGGWAEGYINACYQMGVVAGYGDGTFKPGRELTTAEALTMIINALGVDPGEGDWPTNYMAKAEEMKLYGDLAVKPATNAPLTRDQLAVLAWEGLQYSPTDETGWRIDGYDVLFDSYADALSAAGGNAGLVNEAMGDDSLASKVYGIVSAAGWITGNAATGAKCTVLSDKNGAVGSFDVETGVDMLGHYVTVYYKEQYKSEKQPGLVYAVVDESTVVTVRETVSAGKDYNAAFGTRYDMAGTNGSGVMLFNGTYDCHTGPNGAPKFGAIPGYTAGAAAPTGTYIMVEGAIVAYIAPVETYASYVTAISKAEDNESVSIKQGRGALQIPNTSEDDRVVEYDGMAVGDFVTYVKVATGDGNYVYALSPVSRVLGGIAKTSGKTVDGVQHDTITINGTEYLSFEPANRNYVGTELETELTNISWGQTYVLYLTERGEYIGFEESSGVASLENTVFILESNIAREKNAYGQYVFYNKARGIDMTGAEIEIPIGTAKDANNDGQYDPQDDPGALGDMQKRKHEFANSNGATEMDRVGVFYTVSDSDDPDEKKEGLKTLTPYANGYTGGDSYYISEVNQDLEDRMDDEYQGGTTVSLPIPDGTYANALGDTQYLTIQYDPADPTVPLVTTVEVGSMASVINPREKTVRMLVSRNPDAPAVATNILVFANVIEIKVEWSEEAYIYVSQKQLNEVGLTTEGVSYTVYDATTGKETELSIDSNDCTGSFTTPGFYSYQTDEDNMVRVIKPVSTTVDIGWDIDGKYVPQAAYSLGYLGVIGVHLRAERLGLNLIDDTWFDNADSSSAGVVDLRTAAEIKASGVPEITSRSQMDDLFASDPGTVIIFDLYMTDKTSIMNYSCKSMYVQRVVSGTVGLNSIVYAPDGLQLVDGEVRAVVANSFAAPVGDETTVLCENVEYDIGPGFYRYCVDEDGKLTLVPVIENYAGTAKKWSKHIGWHDKIDTMTQNPDGTYALETVDSCTVKNCPADCANSAYEHRGWFAIDDDTLILNAQGEKCTAEYLHEQWEDNAVTIDYYCDTANGEVARLIVISSIVEKVILSSDCGGDENHTGWTPAGANINNAGNYYLNADSGAITINTTGNVTLCLNGYNISGGLTVTNATVNLCNCNKADPFTAKKITGTGDYAVVVGSGATVTLNQAITCEGVQVNAGAKFIMADGTISGNTATNGGGVYVAGGTFEMKGGAISGNNATDGAGVYLNGGTFTMEEGTISGNTATNGGGVYVADGTFTLKDGTISNNTADTKGGGVYVADGTFTMKNGTISINASGASATAEVGGGVYVADKAKFIMENGTIFRNTGYRGAGVYSAGTFEMENGTISDNTAKNRGAGVYITGGTLKLSGTISNNTASDNGGGVFIAAGAVEVTINGTITGNKSATLGGGVYINAANECLLTIGAGTISGNTATNGDAIYINVGILAIKGGVIDGGIYRGTTTAKITITGGTFTQDPTSYLAEGYLAEQDGDAWVVRGSQCTVTVVQPEGGTVGVSKESGAAGEEVTVTATPDTGYQLGAILVDGEPISGNTFVISRNHTVTATFVAVAACADHAKDGNTLLETGVSGSLPDGIYYLSSDITAGGAITVSGNVTLCLNDHDLTAPNAALGSLITVSAGNLTICGGANGTGTIRGGGDTGTRAMVVQDVSAVIWESGIIDGFSTKNGGAVYVNGAGSSFTMNDGTISNNSATARGGAFYVNSGATFTMNGGTFTGNTGATGSAINVRNGAGVTIRDGKINDDIMNESATITITGGTFAFDPTSYVDTATYNVTDNGDGTWTVE